VGGGGGGVWVGSAVGLDEVVGVAFIVGLPSGNAVGSSVVGDFTGVGSSVGMAVGTGVSVGGRGSTVSCVGVGGKVSVGRASVGVKVGSWVGVRVGVRVVARVALASGLLVAVADTTAGASIAFSRGWAINAVIPTQYSEALKRRATSNTICRGRG